MPGSLHCPIGFSAKTSDYRCAVNGWIPDRDAGRAFSANHRPTLAPRPTLRGRIRMEPTPVLL
jgi:hypothetical protein